MVVDLENSLKFHANFKYELLPKVTMNPTKDYNKLAKIVVDASKSKPLFQSVCDQTMIGHVHNMSEQSSMAEHKVECFYAKKD